jgi:hypothetical protein
LGDPGKGFNMKDTNQIPNGTTVAGQTVDPARDQSKPASVETMVAEIDIQAHRIGPVLEEILKAGHVVVKTAKPIEF